MDADDKQMRLRYAGTCRVCSAPLPARTEAVYERSTRTVRCLTCSPTPSEVEEAARRPEVEEAARGRHETPQADVPTHPQRLPPPAPGTPGASARREYERRHAKREARIRQKHPKLGGLILALSDDPQSTTAWNTGALGEERLGRRLDELSSDKLRVLHDRRLPGTRANVDHLAVTPTGVYVIDAKRYVDKRPTLRIEGGLLRPRVEKLMIGTRDQTKLVDGVLHQVDLVRSILGPGTPVTGVLCFVESDWPLIGGAFTIRGVEVLWPKKLYPRLTADGPHAASVATAYEKLADALRPA